MVRDFGQRTLGPRPECALTSSFLLVRERTEGSRWVSLLEAQVEGFV